MIRAGGESHPEETNNYENLGQFSTQARGDLQSRLRLCTVL